MELTKEQKKIFNKNYRLAKKYFNLLPGYVLHHKDISLRHNDIERYIEWRIEDLEVMTKSEHLSLHNTGEGNPMFGKTTSSSGWKYANVNGRNNSKAVSARNKTMWLKPEYREYMNKKMHLSQCMPIICIETDVEYESLRDAERQLGISKYLLKTACEKK